MTEKLKEIPIPIETYEYLEECAKEHGKTVSELITEIILKNVYKLNVLVKEKDCQTIEVELPKRMIDAMKVIAQIFQIDGNQFIEMAIDSDIRCSLGNSLYNYAEQWLIPQAKAQLKAMGFTQ